jgi:MOSC domain-containing protein YiiM
MPAQVVSVASSPVHTFSKGIRESIQLVEGHGVAGDAHFGVTVKHRSRVAVDPSQPNLRQVHLLHVELFELLRAKGFVIEPGQVGENILTSGIELLSLPVGTELSIGPSAVVRVTGLRNPCAQLDEFRPGLLSAVLEHGSNGQLVRLAGVMGVVIASGPVAAGMAIGTMLPSLPHHSLERI